MNTATDTAKSTFRSPLIALLLSLASVASAQAPGTHWIGTWATSVYEPEPANRLSAADLTDATLRQEVHLSAGGPTLRVHFSNVAGTTPLHITSAHIAKPLAAGKIDTRTDRPLTFSNSPEVTIPPGAEFLSDPIVFPANPLSDLAVTIHLDHAPAHQTGHPGSRATIFYTHGDLTSAADLPDAQHTEHWYFLSQVDVASSGFSVVAFGDSITDGHGAATDANERWPDILAQRLQANAATRDVAVLNQGIGGNHMLSDGLGPNALARLDRDLLAQTGVRYAILFEAINDIGLLSRDFPDATPALHAAHVHNILASYEQFIAQAHAHGILVLGATITPFVGSPYYHPTDANEADRAAINTWIRTPGHFDGLIDFDKATADPANPTHLLPAFDSGDHLHPSPAGYRAMANSIPLTLFR